MSQPEIENRLLALLSDFLDAPADLALDTDFVSGLGLESVQVMEFVMEVEEAFDLAIDLDSLSTVRTLSDLAQVVAKAHGGQP